MEKVYELEKEGWEPYMDTNMIAIQQLRKAVYSFRSFGKEQLNLIINNTLDYLSYDDLEGDTCKEKLINLIVLCQNHGCLDKFVIAYNDAIPNVLDLSKNINIQESIAINLKELSFKVPSSDCCAWRKKRGEKFEYKYLHQPEIIHTEHPCEKLEICKICGKQLNRNIEHAWGEWKYISNDNCRQIRRCERCDEVEKTFFENHIWGEWRYVNDKDCTKIRHCERCGEEYRTNSHDWKNYELPNGSSYKHCMHCHREEYEILGKWKGFVYWSDETQDLWFVDIKKRLFGLRDPKVIIESYVNTVSSPTGLICDYTVVQEGEISVNNNICCINCKKIKKIDRRKNYILDNFEGKILEKCSYIEGVVRSDGMTGNLKLEPII